MSITNKVSGKAQSFSYGGYVIPITKVSLDTKRTCVDVTDSTDYDGTTDMLWESQIPVKLSQELKIEGNYNIVTIPTTIIAALYSGVTAITGSWTIKIGTVIGHGYYDLTDFSASAPVDDKVSYSATLKLNGVYTSGS
jgi:hypothetical protein